jgi:hypothetical protein
MGKTEKQELLKDMKQRTVKAKASKESAVKYLAELGVLTKSGRYTKTYRTLCIKSKAA